MSTRKKPSNLTLVTEGAEPPTPEPLTIEQAAQRLDYRALREATLVTLAEKVQDPLTPPRDLAALSRRMLDVAAELEQMDQIEAAQKAVAEAAERKRSGQDRGGDQPFNLASI